jgi:hypothetical protein
MDSVVNVTYKRRGRAIGAEQLNRSSQHPDITDVSIEDLIAWIKDIVGLVGALWGDAINWNQVGKDLEDLYRTATAGENVGNAVSSVRVLWQGGVLGDNGTPVVSGQMPDEIEVEFVAWSDDDLKKDEFAHVDPRQLARDVGGGAQGAQRYSHSFTVPVAGLAPTPFLLNAAAGDEGYIFNVAVASVLTFVVAPGALQARHSGSLIQGNFGKQGNFELVVPAANGGIAHYARLNDETGHAWVGPIIFGEELGEVADVSCIQSNYTAAPGAVGNLELIARVDDRLVAYWREDRPPFEWRAVPGEIAKSVSGNPALIQGRFGLRGNFELLAPLADGGIAHFFRSNDRADPHWHQGAVFGQELGHVDAVALVQGDYQTVGDGNFEIIGRVGSKLYAWWREDRPNAPFNLIGAFADRVRGTPAFIQGRFGLDHLESHEHGNFELVAPLEDGGLGSWVRINTTTPAQWKQGADFGHDLGLIDSVSLIQSNYGTPGLGNLELVARTPTQLHAFWRPDTAPWDWRDAGTLPMSTSPQAAAVLLKGATAAQAAALSARVGQARRSWKPGSGWQVAEKTGRK